MSQKVLFRGKFYGLQEKDDIFQGSLKKAPKSAYSTIYQENNNQNVKLALAILNEITSAAIMIYFAALLYFDASCFFTIVL